MRDTLIDTLATLVAFDTTSRRSNLPLIHWVAERLSALGIDSRLVRSADGEKANLFAMLGPADAPAIVLSGHSDVVPVDGQDWHGDPFVLAQREGRYYGRGACDMKGFVACVLDWLPEVLAAHRAGRLRQPVALALSYDEEVGCLGVPHLVDDLLQRGVAVAGCIIGEPTLMRPVIAHKGIAHFRCRVRGRSAHSSLTPQGVNAIEYAARLISHIRKLADAEAQFGKTGLLYDVPFATLQTGTIHGGSVPNIVPRECEFVFECRWLPGERLERYVDSVRDYAQTLLEEMRQVAPEADITFEQMVGCAPFESPDRGALIDYVKTLCAGADPQAVAYTTEAGCFSAAGIPCVVVGPGSIEQAHRADEYIEAAQLDACAVWLDGLLDMLCRPSAVSA